MNPLRVFCTTVTLDAKFPLAVILLFVSLISSSVNAQIMPDSTLGPENSQVVSDVKVRGVRVDQITGGATRGSNLFHSFSDFNVPSGRKVYFVSPDAIESILARVTGDNSSNIFGTLSVDGNADLFLMNPNGIVFGAGARLDLDGSFYGITADAIALGDSIYSAVAPEESQLLAVNPSVLLGAYLTDNSGDIISRGGLDIDENITLVGNNITILNSSIRTASRDDAGDIILIANDTVTLDGLDGSRQTKLASGINSGGAGHGGDIYIEAANLTVRNGAQISSSSFGRGDAGNIIINVRETAKFEGIRPRANSPSGVFSDIQDHGEGRAGNIQITASNLQVIDGAQISSSIFGTGTAGNVILLINGTARFDGSDPVKNRSSGAFSRIGSRGEGRGGNVEITTANLHVLRGAQISASTLGTGDAGDVILVVSGTARLDGVDPVDRSPSGVFSNIERAGRGRGGNVKITASRLEVLHGARVGSSIFGRGNAGNVMLLVRDTIRLEGTDAVRNRSGGIFSRIGSPGQGEGGNIEIMTNNLEALNGGRISSSTFGIGNAGDVILVILDTARLEGAGPNDGGVSGVFSQSARNARGQGGDIILDVTHLLMMDGAGVFASSFGQGDAGNINLNVLEQLELSDGTVATNSMFNAGGQIQISSDAILMAGDSNIQTFVSSGDNNGGNITIVAKTLLAFDDSDILAFAVDGRGGNVDLSRTAFFGQDFELAPSSEDPFTLSDNNRVDINATGRISSGTISLSDVSFLQNSLTTLPSNLNVSVITANSCIRQSDATVGSFVVTGSDGLLQQPERSQASYEFNPVRSLSATEQAASQETLVEPQGIYQVANGRLVLSRAC